jgi:putative transposase
MAMTRCTCWFRNLRQLACTLLTFLADGLRFVGLCLRPSPALAAENLFLRKQLALYEERDVKPRRTTPVLRMVLVRLGRWFDWPVAAVCPWSENLEILTP